MKQGFLVNGPDGIKVITPGVLEKDIASEVSVKLGENTKFRQKLVQSCVSDLMSDYQGQSISAEEYKNILTCAVVALEQFVEMTPYKLYKILKQ